MRNSKEIITIIKEQREKLGLSQRELAKRVGISNSTLSRYEKEDREFPINDVGKFAQALNIDLNYLLGTNKYIDDSLKPNLTELEKKITNTVKQLNEYRQIKTLNFATNELEEQNYIKEDTVVYSFVAMYGSISAGTGNYIEDTPIEQIRVEGIPPQHDIALKVNGDSMLPLFEDGEIIYIKKTPNIQNGQIGAFILDGEAYLKKLYIKNGKIRLVSLNKKYKDIEIKEYNDLQVVGRVIL